MTFPSAYRSGVWTGSSRVACLSVLWCVGSTRGTGRGRGHQKASPCGCGRAVHAGRGSWREHPTSAWDSSHGGVVRSEVQHPREPGISHSAFMAQTQKPHSVVTLPLSVGRGRYRASSGLTGWGYRTSQRKRSVLHCQRSFRDGIHSDVTIFTKYNLPASKQGLRKVVAKRIHIN